MYDRRVSAILGEDNSEEDVVWNEMWGGKQYLYPRLLFVITGNSSVEFWCVRSLLAFAYAYSYIEEGVHKLHEGKGPEKQKYEEKIKRLRLKRVAFRTMWLSAEDYPLLLGMPFIFNCICSISLSS